MVHELLTALGVVLGTIGVFEVPARHGKSRK